MGHPFPQGFVGSNPAPCTGAGPRHTFIASRRRPPAMGLFGRKREAGTRCEKCGTELHDPERLRRHMKKAHGNVPAKKPEQGGGDGGLW